MEDQVVLNPGMQGWFNIQTPMYFTKSGENKYDHLNSQKKSDRIKHSFTIKTLCKLGVQGNFLSLHLQKGSSQYV